MLHHPDILVLQLLHSLGANNIGSAGAVALAGALRENNSAIVLTYAILKFLLGACPGLLAHSRAFSYLSEWTSTTSAAKEQQL
jgi:hypothetical protein